MGETILAAAGLGILLLALASLLAWSWALARVLRGEPLLAGVPRRLPAWGLAELLLAIGVYVLSVNLLVVVARAAGWIAPDQAAGGGDDFARLMGLESTARMLAVVAVILWLGLQVRRPLDHLGLVLQPRHLAISLVAVVMLLPPLFLMQGLLALLIEYHHPVLDTLRERPGWVAVVVMGMTTVVVAPLAEEFLFRGLLLGWLDGLAMRRHRRRGGAAEEEPAEELVQGTVEGLRLEAHENPYAVTQPQSLAAERMPDHGPTAEGLVPSTPARPLPWWPLVLSSLLFALVHFGQGPAPITLFFFSLGLGYLYRQTQSLWPPILVHAALNGISTTMTLLLPLQDAV